MRIGRSLVGAGLAALALAGSLARAASAPVPNPAPAAPSPSAEAPAGPSPRVKFDATTVDLGDVVRGNDAVAEFSYANAGDAPLKILSAKPG